MYSHVVVLVIKFFYTNKHDNKVLHDFKIPAVDCAKIGQCMVGMLHLPVDDHYLVQPT